MLPFRLFHCFSWVTVQPYLRAMELSVSPFLTTWVLVVVADLFWLEPLLLEVVEEDDDGPPER